jgi:hypothetical protein
MSIEAIRNGLQSTFLILMLIRGVWIFVPSAATISTRKDPYAYLMHSAKGALMVAEIVCILILIELWSYL